MPKVSGVRNYYDGNTARFLRFGGAGSSGGRFHRLLRMPGVRTPAEAADAVHHVLLAVLAECGIVGDRAGAGGPPPGVRTASASAPPRPLVADLGCGVGATMEWLVGSAEVDAVGITLSPRQAALARVRLAGRAAVVTGSFTSASDLRRMAGGRALDAAVMIESFVHADGVRSLFDALTPLVAPGGVLVICDDLPAPRLLRQLESARARPTREPRSVRRNRRLAVDFRWGWHVNTFLGAGGIEAEGRRAGWRLVRSVDLSRYVVTDRPRDAAARLAAGPARFLGLRSSWWRNVIGGSALGHLARRGLVEYRVLVFER